MADRHAGPAPPDFLLPHLLSLVPARGGRALDAGCGAGRNRPFLIASGFEVIGLDRSRVPGVTVRGDLRTLPFAGETFDLVLCDSVLDTWLGPGHDEAARELKRVLSPGGSLLLVTAALEGSAGPPGARVTGKAELLEWTSGLRLQELLHVKVEYPPAAGVRAQWALAALRVP